MPLKRRSDKARRFTDWHRQMLIDGPDAMLIAGVGYMEGRREAVFALLDEAARADALRDMADDWRRHGAALLNEWRRNNPNTSALPWAATRFRGDP